MTYTRLNPAYGEVKTSEPAAVSVAGNGPWVEVASLELPAGTWVVNYGGAFEANATGWRRLYTSVEGTGRHSPTTRAVGDHQTRMSACMVRRFSSATTVKLYASQNSGAELLFYAYIVAARVG